MTDDEREALAARMQQAYQTKRSELFSLGLPPSGSTEDACMLAALAVAEPVVREDEREACWNVAINEMLAAEADVETASDEDLVARLQSQGAASAAGRIATFIRARGAA